jgi:hypothetical protein
MAANGRPRSGRAAPLTPSTVQAPAGPSAQKQSALTPDHQRELDADQRG